MTNTLGKRLKILREKLGLKQKDVAKELNIQPNVLCRYENGERTPDTETIKVLARFYGTTVDYLLDYDVNKKLKEEKSKNLLADAIPLGKVVRVPIYGEVRAGKPILAREEIIGYEYVPEGDVKGGKYFFLRVKGDSMIGARIQEGDLVLVRRQDTLENGQIGVVIINDEATLKKFYRKGMTVILKPENPAYEPIIAPVKDVRIVGEVVEAKIKFNGR